MARQRIGTSNVSALVKSAGSAYNTIQNNNDTLAAYQFEIDGKTQAAWDTYSSYLNGRKANLTNDPMKTISVNKAINTGFNGYRSAAIQQESQGINYGTSSLYDKRNKLDNLWQQAQAIGDQTTMNSIEMQRSGVDLQIQTQEAAAAKSANGGSSYETQAGVNAEKSFSDQAAIANHLKSQLQQGKISYSDFNAKMQYNQGSVQELSAKIQAEQAARKNGGSTGDPQVAGLSSNDLNSIQTKADSYFGGSEYSRFSPTAMARAANGENDQGLSYDNNGVASSFDIPHVGTFQSTDKSGNNIPGDPNFNPNFGKPLTMYTNKQGDNGSGKFIYKARDANGSLYSQEVNTFDHNADGTHTPYKTINVHQADGSTKQLIEMTVDTGRQNADGSPVTKAIHVDPTKPGAQQFLTDWASNNNTITKAGNDIGTSIAGNPVGRAIFGPTVDTGNTLKGIMPAIATQLHNAGSGAGAFSKGGGLIGQTASTVSGWLNSIGGQNTALKTKAAAAAAAQAEDNRLGSIWSARN